MIYAIGHLNTAPIRSNASHSSEMTSQLLFGEPVEVLEKRGKAWVKVRCAWDNFIGWMHSQQLTLITPTEFESYQRNGAYSLELCQPALGPDFFLPLTFGAQLPEYDGLRFSLGEHRYQFAGQTLGIGAVPPSRSMVVKLARKYLRAPFLPGGRSIFGMDAGGLTQMVYKLAGLRLPRDIEQQLHSGEPVDFIEQAHPGDLAFFENRNGKITHTGILLDNQTIVHAYGMVRIDQIDHFGIFHDQEHRYSHRLRLIKSLLPEENNIASPSGQTNADAIPVDQLMLF